MTTENERLRALAPISDEEVAALALDGERELASAITAKPRRRMPVLLRGGDGQRTRPPLAALVASVALIALAGVGVAVGISGSGGSPPAGGPAGAGGAATSGAEGALGQLPERLTTTAPSRTLPGTTVPNEDVERVERGQQMLPPRYLLPEWRVERVDEQGRDGDMTFARAGSTLELRWLTRSYEEMRDSLAHDAARLPDVALAGGQRAEVFEVGTGFHTAVWEAGGFTFEFRVGASPPRASVQHSPQAPPRFVPSATLTADEFSRLLRSLEQVPVSDWLAAMPEEAVVLDERPQAVDEMLADVPLPPGFDPAGLKRGELVKAPYQLGAAVIGAVSCAWIDRWAEARRAGDRAAVAETAAAMARVADAAVLREMADDGAYPAVIEDYAEAMATPSGRAHDGKGARVDLSAQEGISCNMR